MKPITDQEPTGLVKLALQDPKYLPALYRKLNQPKKKKTMKPTQEQVLQWARESCPYTSEEMRGAYYDGFILAFNFAYEAGRKDENEACAEVCKDGWKHGIGAKHQGDVFAEAIRARRDQ